MQLGQIVEILDVEPVDAEPIPAPEPTPAVEPVAP